jgi:hypothetical protein
LRHWEYQDQKRHATMDKHGVLEWEGDELPETSGAPDFLPQSWSCDQCNNEVHRGEVHSLEPLAEGTMHHFTSGLEENYERDALFDHLLSKCRALNMGVCVPKKE